MYLLHGWYVLHWQAFLFLILLNVRVRSNSVFSVLTRLSRSSAIAPCFGSTDSAANPSFVFCCKILQILQYLLWSNNLTRKNHNYKMYIFILYSPEYLWTGVKNETVAQVFVIDNLQIFNKFYTKITCICFRACTATCIWFPTSQDNVSDKALTILWTTPTFADSSCWVMMLYAIPIDNNLTGYMITNLHKTRQPSSNKHAALLPHSIGPRVIVVCVCVCVCRGRGSKRALPIASWDSF